MSNKPKGNIAGLLIFISLAIIILLLVLLSLYMLPNGIKVGKYVNPVVASKVINGTVYDRNGKILAISEPVYDKDHNLVSYWRSYPQTFHALNVVLEVENAFASYISPIPGFNEATTYGKNVYLTIDCDTQYILDMAVQEIYKAQSPEYVVGFIADAENGEYLAMSNYPDSKCSNKAFISEVNIGNKSIEAKLISKITDSQNKTVLHSNEINNLKQGLTIDDISTIELLNNSNSIYKLIPSAENPKYVVFIGFKNPKISNVETEALNSIIKGLSAQTKI